MDYGLTLGRMNLVCNDLYLSKTEGTDMVVWSAKDSGRERVEFNIADLLYTNLLVGGESEMPDAIADNISIVKDDTIESIVTQISLQPLNEIYVEDEDGNRSMYHIDSFEIMEAFPNYVDEYDRFMEKIEELLVDESETDLEVPTVDDVLEFSERTYNYAIMHDDSGTKRYIQRDVNGNPFWSEESEVNYFMGPNDVFDISCQLGDYNFKTEVYTGSNVDELSYSSGLERATILAMCQRIPLDNLHVVIADGEVYPMRLSPEVVETLELLDATAQMFSNTTKIGLNPHPED